MGVSNTKLKIDCQPGEEEEETPQPDMRALEKPIYDYSVFLDQKCFDKVSTDASVSPTDAVKNSKKFQSEILLEGEFRVIKTIGKGNFGKVLLAKSTLDGKFYALKSFKKELVAKKKTLLQQIQTEGEILMNLQHPFIIKVYRNFQTEEKYFMVMEYCNGGELFFHMQRHRRFSEGTVKFFAAQIYLTLSYLHSNGVLYRDLKPENMIFNNNGYLKLVDFGLAKRIAKTDLPTNSISGTKEYLRKVLLM